MSRATIWGFLLKDTLTCRKGGQGFKPATFQLLNNPLYLLSCSHPICGIYKKL